MKESVDILDTNLEVIKCGTRKHAHDNKLLHRVAVIYIIQEDGKLILQKHLADNLFDHSAGGHIEAGEISFFAAKRELFEELYIDANPIHLGSVINNGTKFNHLLEVYVHKLENPFKFRESQEVKEYIAVDLNSVGQLFKKNNNFTTDFIKTYNRFKRILENYCSEL